MKLPDYNLARKRLKKDYDIKKYQSDIFSFGNNKKYFVKTYGCQMNERDSEIIKGLLDSVGFSETLSIDEAEVIIINSCSIRENAHNKVFGLIGKLKNLKAKNKNLVIALGGCMAQEEGVVNKIIKKYPFVNIVFGTHNIYELPKLIYDSLKEKQQVEILPDDLFIVEDLPDKRASKYQAFINIIYGCNKFCTYCIVPFTRGAEKSRRKEYILDEVKKLKDQGYQEVTLLGQNVNAYGKDLGDYHLPELLADISKIGIPRITFMTSHPWDFTDKLIKVIKENKNILRFIHLPVQSGSNEILKKMGRRYTKEEYLEIIKKLRESIPDISITTDIIVGFPGETEEDFQETLKLAEEVKFDGAYTFIYSKRENTIAATLKDQVDKKIQEERLQRLNEVINKYAKETNENWINKEDYAIITGPSNKKGKGTGYTHHQKVINVEGITEEDYGKIIKVKILEAKTWSLDGKKI